MCLNWRVAITGLAAGVSLFIPALCHAQLYTITTVAGRSALQPGIGDGGPATNAALGLPGRVALDSAGALYIADEGNNLIRKVTPDGNITTVAGDAINQQLGFSGDGGAASSALLSVPSGVAIDSAGNIYIADFGNNRIRMVSSSTGVITTVAGGGTILGGVGPATGVRLVNPQDLAVDANNNLYFAERGADLIRKVTPDGTITTVAGGGSSLGNGGPATSANLDPLGVAVDAGGNLYIADNSNRVFKVTPDGTIAMVAGNGSQSFSGDGGPATTAALNGPNGVAVDAAQNIYISDTGNNRIRLVTPDGTINTIAGNGSTAFTGDGGPALAAGLSPVGIVLGQGGVVYVGDNGFSDRIRLLTPSQ